MNFLIQLRAVYTKSKKQVDAIIPTLQQRVFSLECHKEIS